MDLGSKVYAGCYGKIRVNAVLSSMPEFYEAYGVVPGDGMYKSPEERVSIW